MSEWASYDEEDARWEAHANEAWALVYREEFWK